MPPSLALGVHDAEAARLITGSLEAAGVGRVTGEHDGVLANEDIVAILEPLGREEDHFPLFNRRGVRIGVVLARRSRNSPYRVYDRSLRVVDSTGLAFTIGWSERPTTPTRSDTIATIRDSRVDEIVGHVTTQDGGAVLAPGNRVIARRAARPWTKSGPLVNYVVDPEGTVVANGLDALYTIPRKKQAGGYRRAMMLQFSPQCDANLRALALALRLCELLQETPSPSLSTS